MCAVSGQHTQNFLVFELSVPLKVSAACEEDLTDRENTHVHTHTRCDEYTAGAEDLTKLNFPLLPFPIFHLPQRRRTCVGKNNAHHTHAMLDFLYSHCETPLHTHCKSTPSISTVFLCFLFADFFPCSLLVFRHHSSQFLQLQPYLFSEPYHHHLSTSFPPSLCCFCGAVWLTNSQGETSAGVPAKLPCLSAQITWDSPNYHVANQSISWVSAGDACPPLLWL